MTLSAFELLVEDIRVLLVVPHDLGLGLDPIRVVDHWEVILIEQRRLLDFTLGEELSEDSLCLLGVLPPIAFLVVGEYFFQALRRGRRDPSNDFLHFFQGHPTLEDILDTKTNTDSDHGKCLSKEWL